MRPILSLNSVANILNKDLQQVTDKILSKNIELPRNAQYRYLDHALSRKLINKKFKKRKIVFHIVKGGVGKTTSVLNLAACLNALGAKVLLLDIDPQGNLSDNLGVNAENVPTFIDFINSDIPAVQGIVNISEGFDIIPSRIENVTMDSFLMHQQRPLNQLFANILENVENNYDFVLIDCPPTLGHVVTAAYLYSDYVLSPLNPERFSSKALVILQKEIQTIKKIFRKDIKFKIFLNKYTSNTILSGKTVSDIFENSEYDNIILETMIHYSQEMPNLTAESKCVFSNLRKSQSKEDFEKLAGEILKI